MSQPVTVDGLLEAFFKARQPQNSLETFAEQAEAAGQHQLAKILYVVIASDQYHDKLMRRSLPLHAQSDMDYYVCPHCGLIYESEPPEKCLADETPCEQFEYFG